MNGEVAALEKASAHAHADIQMDTQDNPVENDTTETSSPQSRKSKRLDTAAPSIENAPHHLIQHDVNPNRENHHSTSDEKRQGSSSAQIPLIDDATCLLGISWQRVEGDNDTAAAFRGWKKYIDNQFAAHLHDAQFLMKNRALDVYLIAARPRISSSPLVSASESSLMSFYLFSEDLIHAQLVGSTWEKTIENLKSVPIVFEGADVLKAADRSSFSHHGGDAMMHQHHHHSLLQTHDTQQHVSCGGGNVGMNGGMGMGSGMDVDL